MTEAYREAELREARWDRQCAAAPKCEACGGSIYPFDHYLEIEGHIFCQRCVELFTRSTEDLKL